MPISRAFWTLTTLETPKTWSSVSSITYIMQDDNFRLFWIRKKSLPKLRHPKIYLPNFPCQIPEYKISNPKKSFGHPLRSIPLPLGRCKRNSYFDFAKWRPDNHQFLSWYSPRIRPVSPRHFPAKRPLRREARKDGCIRWQVMITCRV